MASILRSAAVAAFVFALAGCYQTFTPLIAAANADYPLGRRMRRSQI